MLSHINNGTCMCMYMHVSKPSLCATLTQSPTGPLPQGSTCAMVESMLRASGYKTGLFTSPHLCDIRERFRIQG